MFDCEEKHSTTCIPAVSIIVVISTVISTIVVHNLSTPPASPHLPFRSECGCVWHLIIPYFGIALAHPPFNEILYYAAQAKKKISVAEGFFAAFCVFFFFCSLIFIALGVY